jgi:hypothetical protein
LDQKRPLTALIKLTGGDGMSVSGDVHVILVDRPAIGDKAASVLCFAVRCSTPDDALALIRTRLAFGEAARLSGIPLSQAEGSAFNLQPNQPKLITELLANPLNEI